MTLIAFASGGCYSPDMTATLNQQGHIVLPPEANEL